MKCLVIIPAYNEAENIAATVDELLAKTRSFPMELDYLVVNDGSSDNTEAVLREHGFHFITLPVNLGIGGAVQSGYLYAQKNNFDIAVQMDGDGQHMPEYLPDLIQPILEGKAACTIGSRFLGLPAGHPVFEFRHPLLHGQKIYRRHIGLPGGQPAGDRSVCPALCQGLS